MSNSLWCHVHQASLSIINFQSLLKLMPIESVIPSNHLILCCPLLFPPSVFPRIRVFSNESVLHIRWPMYWSFSFSISPTNEDSGLISFRMDWLDLPRWTDPGGEFWQNAVHWRREWQITSVFLPWEPHGQYEKAKKYDTERWTPQVNRWPICYWWSEEK